MESMRRPPLLSLIATVACMLVLVPATAEADLPVRELRVLTYNIHHGAGVDGVLDLERIAQVIEASSADVVALQEVDRHWSERSQWVDQPAWFAARLRMHHVYAANLDLDPLEPGQPRRQYGTLILSRYPIKESRNTLLPKFPGQEQRGLLEATIKVRGKTIRFANTHLTHNNNAERLEQAKRVVELLDESLLPTLLVGDLNAVDTTPEMKLLTDRLGDVWPAVGEGPGYTSPAPVPTHRIDYVLHSDDIRPLEAEVLSTPASDHLPVAATVIIG
jgi:endonuclease/exonuclease/phosphatase family metal-dependent hydrolase